MNLERFGLDMSKAVFTLHGVDQDEKAVLQRNMRRAEMEAFFAKLPPTHVVLEACGGSHHWGRRLSSFGHTVQLMETIYQSASHQMEYGYEEDNSAAMPYNNRCRTVKVMQ